LVQVKTNLATSVELTKTILFDRKICRKDSPIKRMQFDETSPKKRNPKQQITSRNATKNRPTGNTALYFGKSILNELGCRTHDQSRGTSVSLL